MRGWVGVLVCVLAPDARVGIGIRNGVGWGVKAKRGRGGVGGGRYTPRGGVEGRVQQARSTRGYPDLVEKPRIPDDIFTTKVANRPTVQTNV